MNKKIEISKQKIETAKTTKNIEILIVKLDKLDKTKVDTKGYEVEQSFEQLPSTNVFEKEFITPVELQSLYNISLKEQERLRFKKNQLKQGSLPFYKQGKKIFYNIFEIKEWIRSHKIIVE